jgi:hypothetical protein
MSEITVSHAIRNMRWTGERDIAKMMSTLYGGFRPKSLIPWPMEQFPGICEDPAISFDSDASDLRFTFLLGGRPWPTQLLEGRHLTKDTFWNYILEKSNKARHLRYCPACAMAQESANGFSWWQHHQNLPGVITCATHEIQLLDVPWDTATQRWGNLPHNLTTPNEAEQSRDDRCALDFSSAIRSFASESERYCPLVVSMLALETVLNQEGCHRNDVVYVFMERFANRFPRQIQSRIGRNEVIAPDVQVRRLISQSILETPLATALIALTAFRTVASFRDAYSRLVRDSTIDQFGSFTPGRILDKMIDRYPLLGPRLMLH